MSDLISRLTWTIPNGQAVSAAVEITSYSPAVIEMPTAWTAANLTFLCSSDNVTYFNLCDSSGAEILITGAALQRIVLGSTYFHTHKYLKIRSGTYASPVNQGAERTIYLELWE